MMTIHSNFISVTDLRTKTTEVLRSLSKNGAQYVLSNNKPQAVIITPDDFDYFQRLMHAEQLKHESREALLIEKRMNPQEATEYLESFFSDT